MDGTTYPRMNRVFLTGIAQEQPELRYTPSGVMVCSFRVQVGRILRDRSGGAREVAAFLTVVAWQEAAQRVSRELHKGQALYIEGYVSSRSFTTARGDKRTAVEIYAEQIQTLGPFAAEAAGGGGEPTQPAQRSERSRPERPARQESVRQTPPPSERPPAAPSSEEPKPEPEAPSWSEQESRAAEEEELERSAESAGAGGTDGGAEEPGEEERSVDHA